MVKNIIIGYRKNRFTKHQKNITLKNKIKIISYQNYQNFEILSLSHSDETDVYIDR